MRKCHRWEDWWKLFGQGYFVLMLESDCLEVLQNMWIFYQMLRTSWPSCGIFLVKFWGVEKIQMGLWSLQAMRLGPRTEIFVSENFELSSDSKNSPKIRSLVMTLKMTLSTQGCTQDDRPMQSPELSNRHMFFCDPSFGTHYCTTQNVGYPFMRGTGP